MSLTCSRQRVSLTCRLTRSPGSLAGDSAAFTEESGEGFEVHPRRLDERRGEHTSHPDRARHARALCFCFPSRCLMRCRPTWSTRPNGQLP
jgi:hypothetical protein